MTFILTNELKVKQINAHGEIIRFNYSFYRYKIKKLCKIKINDYIFTAYNYFINLHILSNEYVTPLTQQFALIVLKIHINWRYLGNQIPYFVCPEAGIFLTLENVLRYKQTD